MSSGLDVDRAVRREVDGIDVRQRAGGMRPADDLGDRVDRAERIGRIADGDEPGPVAEGLRSRSSRSSVPSSAWMSTVRTVTPRSSAIARQGETFASWSRVVTTISSPGWSVLPIERLRWNVSVVMFAPNLISSPLRALRNSASAGVRAPDDLVAAMGGQEGAAVVGVRLAVVTG